MRVKTPEHGFKRTRDPLLSFWIDMRYCFAIKSRAKRETDWYIRGGRMGIINDFKCTDCRVVSKVKISSMRFSCRLTASLIISTTRSRSMAVCISQFFSPPWRSLSSDVVVTPKCGILTSHALQNWCLWVSYVSRRYCISVLCCCSYLAMKSVHCLLWALIVCVSMTSSHFNS